MCDVECITFNSITDLVGIIDLFFKKSKILHSTLIAFNIKIIRMYERTSLTELTLHNFIHLHPIFHKFKLLNSVYKYYKMLLIISKFPRFEF